ncbi:MAG: hypothetical protein U5Q44_01170 [Dehalococcoidia bacterium]|nr:hypothetical protein [Dehalococcoidia bacterium]
MTVATDAFEDLVKLEAQQRGMPDLHYVVVPHPLGGLKPEAMHDKAAPVRDELLRLLTS